MSLFPKPNIPEYLVELISTKKKHKIRPYTCGEQEALLLALETSGEMDVIANACEKIVESCTNNIDIQELPSFDFEYLFLKISTISSESKRKLKIPHLEGDCQNIQEVEIDLNNIKIRQNDNHKSKIDLDSNIGCEMRYPTFREVLEKDEKELLISCIKTIYDAENVYPCDKSNRKDLEEWLEGLQNKHYKKIKEFFETSPKIYLELTWTCEVCGKTETRIFEDFGDFFI